jgi:ABC-2 type transport system permease protein
MITLHRTGAMVLRQYYLMSGSLTRFVPIIVWGTVDIVMWGFLTKYLSSATGSSFHFVPTLLGAVLLWDSLIRVMQGVTTTFFEDVWARNFLNLFATPITIPEYVTGLIVISICSSSFGILTMLVVSTAVFGFSFFSFGILLVPYVLVLFLFGITLGIFGCALVMRYGPTAEWFIWPIPAVISPFAGVLYPISTLPGWMQVVSRILPPAYVFENMRAIILNGKTSWNGLAIGTAMALVYLFLATFLFIGVYRKALRSGLIARYSAEGVS